MASIRGPRHWGAMATQAIQGPCLWTPQVSIIVVQVSEKQFIYTILLHTFINKKGNFHETFFLCIFYI